jgi:hypothetical protein
VPAGRPVSRRWCPGVSLSPLGGGGAPSVEKVVLWCQFVAIGWRGCVECREGGALVSVCRHWVAAGASSVEKVVLWPHFVAIGLAERDFGGRPAGPLP